MLEVHAVDGADQSRRHHHHRDHRKQLDDVVLLDADEAKHRVEQKCDVVRLIGGVVRQRLHVTLHGLDLRAHLLWPPRRLVFVRQKQDEAADRDQAFANLGAQIALAAEREQDALIDPRRAAPAPALLEDPARDLIDLGADPFENVRVAVDDRIQKIHQHRLTRDIGGAEARQLVPRHRKRTRLAVTDCHQPLAGEDEGDRGGHRRRRVRLRHQRRCHVARAVFHIETAGNLDFLHFLTGRNRNADPLLDLFVFLETGIDQVQPDRRLRNLVSRLQRMRLQRGATQDIDGEHEPSPQIRLSP